jgi:hypothetical protein
VTEKVREKLSRFGYEYLIVYYIYGLKRGQKFERKMNKVREKLSRFGYEYLKL